MSIRSSCQHLTIRALWLAAATTASGGCILLNPSYGSTGASATEATGDDASTTAEDPTTAASTSAEDSTTAAASTAGATTDAESSTTSSIGTDGSTGDERCPECAAEKITCDASLACWIVREFAEDCDYERVCINDQACASLPQKEAAEGLTLWNALARCDALECMEQPPTVCVAEQETCDANPACAAMSACASLECSCLPDPYLLTCWADCGEAHPAGVEDWQDWLGCIAEQGAGDGPPTPRATDAAPPEGR